MMRLSILRLTVIVLTLTVLLFSGFAVEADSPAYFDLTAITYATCSAGGGSFLFQGNASPGSTGIATLRWPRGLVTQYAHINILPGTLTITERSSVSGILSWSANGPMPYFFATAIELTDSLSSRIVLDRARLVVSCTAQGAQVTYTNE